jgi:hypothetical protein
MASLHRWRPEVPPEQVGDVLDRDVRGRAAGQRRGVVGVVPLAREDRGHAGAPGLLHRGQDAQLVVDQHVVARRVALLDVVQLPLLVDVDEHAALDGVQQPGALDLARLEDHVAVGDDDGESPGAEPLDQQQRPRQEAVGERVVQQEERDLQELRVARVLGPVALQGAEVVRVPDLARRA